MYTIEIIRSDFDGKGKMFGQVTVDSYRKSLERPRVFCLLKNV